MRIFLSFCGLISGGFIVFGGVKAINIESALGNTVAEAYYNSVGFALVGLGIFIWIISGYLASKYE